MIISGTACTSISGERSSNSEFATCFASGLGASGVTYQCGYRDMFSVAKPLLSLYENVNKVSQRSLAHRVYRYIFGTKAGLLWDLHYLYIYDVLYFTVERSPRNQIWSNKFMDYAGPTQQ